MSCPVHPWWPNRREDCPFCERPENFLSGGQFYELTPGATIPLGNPTPSPRAVDKWICRRVADFPGARVPTGGEVAACSMCRAPIVFNPTRTVDGPKVCMQCARIQPLPIDS